MITAKYSHVAGSWNTRRKLKILSLFIHSFDKKCFACHKSNWNELVDVKIHPNTLHITENMKWKVFLKGNYVMSITEISPAISSGKRATLLLLSRRCLIERKGWNDVLQIVLIWNCISKRMTMIYECWNIQ